MLRHIVMVRFAPEATEAERQAVQDAIEALPDQVPEIRGLHCGRDVGRLSNSYDFAAVMDFEDRAAFQRYIQSEPHKAYVSGAGNAVASLAVVQHPW